MSYQSRNLSELCCICLSNPLNGLTECEHPLCGNCVSELSDFTCPICYSNLPELDEYTYAQIIQKQEQDQIDNEIEDLLLDPDNEDYFYDSNYFTYTDLSNQIGRNLYP